MKILYKDRNEEFLLLTVLCLFSIGLFIVRFLWSDTRVFVFLNRNLFLALIPLLISTFLLQYEGKDRYLIGVLVVSWVLFFPNAPYILTDLFHLRERESVPVWYDLLVILSYAWSGLLFGLVSLRQMETYLSRFFDTRWVTIVATFFPFLSSFGVYLGRFHRWNSWDIINQPFALFADIFHHVISPLEHPRIWVVTLLLGILLNLMYYSLKIFKRI